MNEDRDHRNAFNPRFVNVLKLRSAAECTILIEECRRVIADIDDQMSIPDFGDEEWAEAAIKAKSDVEHKMKLAQLRLADILEREERGKRAAGMAGSASSFETRFLAAAKEMLTADLFACIVDKAKAGE